MTSASMRIVSSFILVVFVLLHFSVLPAYAQANSNAERTDGSLGVARMVQTKNKNVKDGTIMSTGKNGLAEASTVPYDSQVQGVVARDAGIVINNSAYEGVPLISVGTVYAMVSSLNGPIKKGDLIATSELPGVGVKAVKDGYVLGAALEDYNSADPKRAGIIALEFNLHYFNAKPQFPGSLTDILKIALLPTKDGPTPLFKYIVAGIVVVASFILAFMTFGRTAAKGVEALGRNPAASRIIHLGIIFNVGIVVIIVLAGLTVAFLILRL